MTHNTFIKSTRLFISIAIITCFFSCSGKKIDNKDNQVKTEQKVTAKDILGNPEYQAISYGGYRQNSRDIQPTVEEIKEDMKILFAMGIRVLRTYNTKLQHATTVLQAIKQLKEEEEGFEMYVMLGAWIDCLNAWTDIPPNHDAEDEDGNRAEIERAVKMANEYPDIVKVIAVGNEAMVKWAASYYVQAWVILKWVNHLQELKRSGELPEGLWITSSDNFASWGGGEDVYHTEDLTKLFSAVDYVSIHTYPMHDTHYNPVFWGIAESEADLSDSEKIESAMIRARDYAKSQFKSVVDYMKGLGIDKPVHIGETGWASFSNGHYGKDGSQATDEYKEARFYDLMREWTNSEGISCFYFEAFDEIWKDAGNPGGSENFFGLFTIEGKAKYALWGHVDKGTFEGFTRGGNPITKTYDGNKDELMKDVYMPPIKSELGSVMEPQK
ncbi:MAG: glycosyl hydrolase family 17 [Saprospiraceae bacterium]|nr:glycosyl hydrolase family 17 [Saprospiraceae bacterium]